MALFEPLTNSTVDKAKVGSHTGIAVEKLFTPFRYLLSVD
jgi:hypothetical protein